MRAALVVLLSAVPSLADVGPRPPSCAAQDSCVSCQFPIGTDDTDPCVAAALDGGLVKQQCVDRLGSAERRYYCPAGKSAVRPLCSASPGLLGGALLVLSVLGRRRRG